MTRYFSPKGHAQHSKRIKELEEELRAIESQLGDAVANAGSGSWHDNASYETLNRRIGIADRRLSDAHRLFADAEIIEYPKFSPFINLGARVRVVINSEKLTYDIVAYGESDLDKRKILYDSPIAEALIGHFAGQIVEFHVGEEKRRIEIRGVMSIPEGE